MSSTRKLLLYIVYLLLVMALGVGIYLAFHNSSGNKTVIKAPLTTKSQPQDSRQPIDKPESSSPSKSAEAAAKAVQAALAADASRKTPSALANTGPGSVLGLFAITVLVSTLGYQRLLRSKT